MWYEKKSKSKAFKEARAVESAKFRKDNPEKRMLQAARDRAKRFGLDIDIELEDIVIPSICPILKVPLERNTSYAPSLDKIDPAKGYTKGNVQVISMKANLMKQDATPEELRRFAKWVNLSQP